MATRAFLTPRDLFFTQTRSASLPFRSGLSIESMISDKVNLSLREVATIVERTTYPNGVERVVTLLGGEHHWQRPVATEYLGTSLIVPVISLAELPHVTPVTWKCPPCGHITQGRGPTRKGKAFSTWAKLFSHTNHGQHSSSIRPPGCSEGGRYPRPSYCRSERPL